VIDDLSAPKEEFITGRLTINSNRGAQPSIIELEIQPFEHIPSAALVPGVKKQEVIEGDGYTYNLE